MAHDVFISHSTKNKAVADAVCATLENAAIRCWIAPRDVQFSRPFPGEITRAIKESKAIVLIFSADSNNSPQILRELQLAADARLHIIQFRIEDVAPNDDLQFYLSSLQWFDAMTPPLDEHLGRLAIALQDILGLPKKDIGKSVREILPPPAASEKERVAAAAQAVTGASKERPYGNSLGMKFVPVPGTRVLFSIWETRVKNYKVFVEAKNRHWPKPSFQQTEEHPAVNVSWEDATAFCEWLTEQERSAGRISAKQSYRLPSDEEWSAAVGLEKEGGSTPKERHTKVQGVYPWGTKWPPPNGAGNYDPSLKVDDYENTSPAGSFEANRYGIHDLGGNVWEWCQDWYDAEKKYRVLRGASWGVSGPDYLLSSCRVRVAPEARSDLSGFRCVLVMESSR
jgi:Sulfatase-modifying factor enzyme 1/TIR domain